MQFITVSTVLAAVTVSSLAAPAPFFGFGFGQPGEGEHHGHHGLHHDGQSSDSVSASTDDMSSTFSTTETFSSVVASFTDSASAEPTATDDNNFLFGLGGLFGHHGHHGNHGHHHSSDEESSTFESSATDSAFEPSITDSSFEPSFTDSFEPSATDSFLEPSVTDSFEPSATDSFEPSSTDSFDPSSTFDAFSSFPTGDFSTFTDSAFAEPTASADDGLVKRNLESLIPGVVSAAESFLSNLPEYASSIEAEKASYFSQYEASLSAAEATATFTSDEAEPTDFDGNFANVGVDASVGLDGSNALSDHIPTFTDTDFPIPSATQPAGGIDDGSCLSQCSSKEEGAEYFSCVEECIANN
ncbi:hypothetical protein HDZ31DRAFT_42964 [Schizophyllum fasciatum]